MYGPIGAYGASAPAMEGSTVLDPKQQLINKLIPTIRKGPIPVDEPIVTPVEVAPATASRVPLYAGLGIGVAVLAAGYFWWRRR